MGRKNYETVYTDVSEAAGWRATEGASTPWDQEPSFAQTPGFSIRMVKIDFMHTFHMGVCRDLVGSSLKIIACNKAYFLGRNIETRLKQILRAVREFARGQGKQISIKKLTKNSLNWSANACPEFKGSAYDSGVFLAWLSWVMSQQSPEEPWRGLPGVLWCAHRLCQILTDSNVFLSENSRNEVGVLSKTFLAGYARLASVAAQHAKLHFKMRPKLHFLQHLLEDSVNETGSHRSGGWDSTWLDEDLVRFSMKQYRKMAHKSAALNILRRNLVQVKQTLLDLM